MIEILKSWIDENIKRGRFTGSHSVLKFAASRTIVTIFIALILNMSVYLSFDYFGLFGVKIPASPIGDAVVTACVAGPISFLAYIIFGKAILDLAVSRDEFQRLSRTDPLTGLLNRRAFIEVIAQSEAPYALAVLDIDHFKSVNDTHGHGAGDDVLVTVSTLLKDHFGCDDRVARLGGEEFGVLLRSVGKAEAMARMDAFRLVLSERKIDVGSAVIAVSISAGVSQAGELADYSSLLTFADRALYLAKASGRNRVVHADDLGPLAPRQPVVASPVSIAKADRMAS